jgi:hypothetical protein
VVVLSISTADWGSVTSQRMRCILTAVLLQEGTEVFNCDGSISKEGPPRRQESLADSPLLVNINGGRAARFDQIVSSFFTHVSLAGRTDPLRTDSAQPIVFSERLDLHRI